MSGPPLSSSRSHPYLPPSTAVDHSQSTQNLAMYPHHNMTMPFHAAALAPAPTLTLNPSQSHLEPQASTPTLATSAARPSHIARAHSVTNNGTVNLDPVPGDPDTTFIHPPFTEFPGAEKHKGGLTYMIMAANPEWFLDVRDFVGENAVGYPTQLEPPRGWCPAKKKDIKDGWKEGEEPRLRCTFCRRTYAGVNAKSMWRRHVYEKHKVPMANRRETADRTGGRGGRSSNKENKTASVKAEDVEKSHAPAAGKSVRRSVSMELPSTTAAVPRQPSPGPSRLRELEAPPSPVPTTDNAALSAPAFEPGLYSALSLDDPSEIYDDGAYRAWQDHQLLLNVEEGMMFRTTPPQTPGLTPSKSASKLNIPPESPYDPRRTPAFRHSPARLPSDQPWRNSGAAVNQAVRQLTLGMLVCGEASPNVRGLDVSPLIIVPASERKGRSIFSPPNQQTPERRLALLDMHSETEPDLLFPSPRRLFDDLARPDKTPSIMSRMGDFDWSSPNKYFIPPPALPEIPTPGGEIEDPFKAYLHLSPAPKVAGDSSPAHPPSSSGSDSPASRRRLEGSSAVAESLRSPTPAFGPSRPSLSSMSKLRWRVFPEEDGDVDMDSGDDSGSLPRKPDFAGLGLGTPIRVADPAHKRTESGSSAEGTTGTTSSVAPSSSGSDKAPASSSSSTSVYSRRDSSPFRFTAHGRQRSSSSAGPSSSASGSSSSHKGSLGPAATAGLMDKILGRQEKPQRRRTSHNHEGEVSVDAMGSPFKLGRKTSRNEFLYSLDGDCEMQEAQPKKRRKTISGRD